MTPLGARLAFQRLNLTVAEAAKIFGRTERRVFYWLSPEGDGPPEHIALALTEIEAGRLDRTNWQAVRSFVKKCYSRRDGDRYRRFA